MTNNQMYSQALGLDSVVWPKTPLIVCTHNIYSYLLNIEALSRGISISPVYSQTTWAQTSRRPEPKCG